MALNVGEAFLQITPSLEGLHEKIAAEAANIADIVIKVTPDTTGFAEKVRADLANMPEAQVKVTADVAALEAKLAEAKAKLDELGAKTSTPKVDADITAAKAHVDELKAQLDAISNKKVTIDVDDTAAKAHVDEVKADLDTLHDKRVTVDVDTKDGASKIRELGTEADNSTSAFQRLGAAGSPLGAAISAAIIPALTSIGQLSGALGLLPSVAAAAGTGFATVAVGVQGMSAAFKAAETAEKANEAATKADAQAQKDTAAATTASAAAGKGNIAVLQQAVAAGAAHVAQLKAEQAAGQNVTAELKAAETAQAANVAALKTAQAASTGNTGAINNMNAAQKQANTSVSQAKAAHEAAAKAADAQAASMNNLAPAAQGVVSAVLQLEPAFTSLRMDVQQHLFDGLKQTLLDTANTALPVVRTGLTQMGDAINTAVKNVGSFIQQQSSVQAWQAIFANIGQAATNLAGAVKPILQIITDVTQVGSQFLPQLAQHFSDAAQKAADFVSKAKETGQLAQWIQTGITAVKDLWDAFKNVVAILKDLAAAPGFGPNFLQALKDVTGGIKWLLDNIPGLTSVVQAFIDAWVLAKIVTGIQSVVTTVGGLGTALDGAIAKLGALTTAETAAGTAATATGTAVAGAGTAATGAAAGFTGMLGPLAALAAAVYEATTHWQAFIQGFKDMGAVAVQGGTEIVDSAKAIGDGFTGNFAAAGRALDDANKKFQDLRTQLNDHSGFDSAKQSADGLATSIDKASKAASDYSTAITGSVSAEVGYKAALDGVTTSVAQNTNTTDLNTAAGRANVTAVANLISQATQYEAAQKAAGASDTDLTNLHNTLATSIQDVVTKMGLTGPAVTSMVSAFTAAKPALDIKATLDTQGVTAGVAAAKAALAGLPQTWQVKIAGEAADLLAKVSQAGAAVQSVPQTHMTTFTGDGANLLAAAAGGTTAITGVVPDWLTKFAGDAANLVGAATTGEAALEGVKSTHGSTFTGDASGLIKAATDATTEINKVPTQPPASVLTADITDITTKTQTASTQIAAVAATHVTTITGDLTGTTGITQSATDATTQINAIPATHKTTLTIDDAAALAEIQNFIQQINSIPTSHVTTLSTVQGAAGGGIIMKMAIGGVVPMADGGAFSPMGADRAAIVPPNTMRLIGDRPVDDEAFIPINNSGVSQAILTETASRMGYNVAPMSRGGRSWGDDDDDFWGWFRHGRGRGGPSSSGSTLTASAAAVPDMRRMVSQYQTAGGTASISAMRAYHQADRPAAPAPAAPPPVNIHCDASNLGRLLFELFRSSIRAQGGNVQVALGS